jgi:two-component system, cell cycle sensor histidine kinase and response regulator CckA
VLNLNDDTVLKYAGLQPTDRNCISSSTEPAHMSTAAEVPGETQSNAKERVPPEERSMDSEARYRRLFETARDGILILDEPAGQIIDVNPFLAELLDYSREELLGKALWDIGLFKDIEASKRTFQELIAKRYVRYENLPLRTRGGQSISVEVVSNVYRVSGDSVIQCNIRDIRHRKNAEQTESRLRQAHKMEAVGQLAGGLAHDFNNLLGVILGYCEILETQTTLPDPTRGMIMEIHNAGVSAKNLTQRLLAFSRRQVLQPVVLDLNETVRRIERMLGRMIGDDVELVSVLGDDLERIKADPSQVEQVLMNLAINARDAMPKGGRICIKTVNVEINESNAGQYTYTAAGRYVMLSMSDTGTGMDLEVQSHIFEPFFSTKPPGQGTGLGLSTVFGIVKQSGGAIAVYSEPDVGTTFKILFPRCDDVPIAKELGEAMPLRGGTETILLVDDAASLRGLTRRLLEDCGYTVLDSGDPVEALRMAEEHMGPLPLMITDVVMPGFSGSVLAEKLAAIRPETKVLYASGYNDDSIIQLRVRGQDYAFLEKPFTREDLLRKVRGLLDSSIQRPS